MNKKPEIENKQPNKNWKLRMISEERLKERYSRGKKTATHDKHVGASKKKSTQRTLKDIYPTFNAFEF